LSERIQKALASAGVASRRAIEEMIREGRVIVNGRPAEIGQSVSADDKIRVDGRPIKLSRKPEATRVLLYRKRVGEVVTREDPEGRRTVFRKLPELENSRWIAVGRLDINTSGLLLLTNDGELARRLMHPSFEVRRQYAVRVLGTVNDETLRRLGSGVELDDGPARFETIQAGEGADDDEATGEDGGAANSWWHVTVKQGRNRVVRRLFESQNCQVSRLIRVAYGPVQLGRGIRSGSYREATPEELQALQEAVGLKAPEVEPARKPAARRAAGRAPRPRGPRKPGAGRR
jgi:pseudouridine synthase